jgi:hypothetical protein
LTRELGETKCLPCGSPPVIWVLGLSRIGFIQGQLRKETQARGNMTQDKKLERTDKQVDGIDDYELKIDEQVSQFLGLNHTITFFLITAAVATLGFTLNFAASNKIELTGSDLRFYLIVFAALSAMLAAGLALLALTADISSFRIHLRYRYERKKYADISKLEKTRWDRIIRRASWARKASFFLLIVTVSTQCAFLVVAIKEEGASAMHHYGEDSTEVIPTQDSFDIIFTNKTTGQKIKMNIPRVGVQEDPSKGLTTDDVTTIAHRIAHILRDEFK